MLGPAGAIGEGHRSVSETTEWAIPEAAQPKAAECAFDLERALSSVLALRSEIPEDAFTASILGTERAGNGVLIRDGRAGAHDRLPDHRGRDHLALRQRRRRRAGACRGLRPGERLRPGPGARPARRAGAGARHRGALERRRPGDRRRRRRPARTRSRRGSSRSASSPATGSTCSTRRCSRCRRTRAGAVPPASAPTAASPGIGSLFVQEARGEGIASQGNMIVPIELLRADPRRSAALRPGRPAAAALARPLRLGGRGHDLRRRPRRGRAGAPGGRAPGRHRPRGRRHPGPGPRRHLPPRSGRSARPAPRSRSP